jgi:hypothetical protein
MMAKDTGQNKQNNVANATDPTEGDLFIDCVVRMIGYTSLHRSGAGWDSSSIDCISTSICSCTSTNSSGNGGYNSSRRTRFCDIINRQRGSILQRLLDTVYTVIQNLFSKHKNHNDTVSFPYIS